MSKFKIGDRVKVAKPSDITKSDLGKEFVIKTNEHILDDEQSWWGPGVSWRHKESALELVSPVRTVTRKEIVAGVYGKVVVKDSEVAFLILSFLSQYGEKSPWSFTWTASETRAAAATLIELADALENPDA